MAEYASYLRHHKMIVACAQGKSRVEACAQVDWVRTNRFLALAGRLCSQICVQVERKQVLDFLKTNPDIIPTVKLEDLQMDVKNDDFMLVAVMPLEADDFDEFMKWMHIHDNQIEQIVRRCQILDALCRGEEVEWAQKIGSDLTYAMTNMITDDDSLVDQVMASWRLSHAKDPVGTLGRAWARQIVGVPQPDRAVEASVPHLGKRVEDDLDDDTKEQRYITVTSCVSDAWYRDLVCLREERPDRLVPLSCDNNNSGATTVYSIIDPLLVQNECRAILKILHFFHSYHHTTEFLTARRQMCEHPILAHALTLDPEAVIELLSMSPSNCINLASLSAMIRHCAITEVDNHVRLNLPLTDLTPIWLPIHRFVQLAPLNLREESTSLELLNRFVGGYLLDLDLSETIVTGPGIAMSTIITPAFWKQSAVLGLTAALDRLASLYPCVVTVPESLTQYQSILQKYKSTSEFHQESHRIITLCATTTITTTTTNDLGLEKWNWVEPRVNESSSLRRTFVHFNPLDQRRKMGRQAYGMRLDNVSVSPPPPPTATVRVSTLDGETDDENEPGATATVVEDTKSRSRTWLWSSDDTSAVSCEKMKSTTTKRRRYSPPPLPPAPAIGEDEIEKLPAPVVDDVKLPTTLAKSPCNRPTEKDQKSGHTSAAAMTSAAAAVAEAAPASLPVALQATDKQDSKRDDMIVLGENETLSDYFKCLQLDWTFIDDRGPSSIVLSCKFDLLIGADVQLMVLTDSDPHLERVARQHLTQIRRHWPTATLFKLSTSASKPSGKKTWYAIVDPMNVGRFRVVSIYRGCYRDILMSPLGMTRGGYTQNKVHNKAQFFGSPTFVLSALHARSPNYVHLPLQTSAKTDLCVAESWLNYKMRGFSWPCSMSTERILNGAFEALQAWAQQHPEWSPFIDQSCAPAELPAVLGVGHFNITDIIPIQLLIGRNLVS